jgi:hypothetical protein
MGSGHFLAYRSSFSTAVVLCRRGVVPGVGSHGIHLFTFIIGYSVLDIGYSSFDIHQKNLSADVADYKETLFFGLL